ncbi:hypothetical protein [Embleya sp. NPDC020630]|uniref:hypothetical protein n=1 Tax=Embleya sp. NPDC020630 TaxID=3363979 RepID=UPI0037972323
MTTEIASHIPGRAVPTYDLLNDMRHYVGSDREAHDAIHAYLGQIVDIDGEDTTILSRRAMRPELLEMNANDVDVYWWLTISDDAEQTIRDAFAAAYPQDDNTTVEVYYEVEVSDDGQTWAPEKDEARGTEAVEDATPDEIARDILVNRINELTAEDTETGHLRVRVWRTEDEAAGATAPLAVATHTP